MINRLIMSSLLALYAVLVAVPAHALMFAVDEQICPAYSSDNVRQFFDYDESYISGEVSLIGPHGLINIKHPGKLTLQHTDHRDGRFYQIYQIHALIVVKNSSGIVEDRSLINVLDLSLCDECSMKSEFTGRYILNSGATALFKLIPTQQLDEDTINNAGAHKGLSVDMKRVYSAIISSLRIKGIAVDYIMHDTCNVYRVAPTGESDVIESYLRERR